LAENRYVNREPHTDGAHEQYLTFPAGVEEKLQGRLDHTRRPQPFPYQKINIASLQGTKPPAV
jgi:hypothetical protein